MKGPGDPIIVDLLQCAPSRSSRPSTSAVSNELSSMPTKGRARKGHTVDKALEDQKPEVASGTDT